jgi:hypothetical protein
LTLPHDHPVRKSAEADGFYPEGILTRHNGFLPDKIMPIINSEPVSTKVRFLMPDPDWPQPDDRLLCGNKLS